MTEIKVNNRVYITHPFYDLYAGSKEGEIIHIINKFHKRGMRMVMDTYHTK